MSVLQRSLQMARASAFARRYAMWELLEALAASGEPPNQIYPSEYRTSLTRA